MKCPCCGSGNVTEVMMALYECHECGEDWIDFVPINTQLSAQQVVVANPPSALVASDNSENSAGKASQLTPVVDRACTCHKNGVGELLAVDMGCPEHGLD